MIFVNIQSTIKVQHVCVCANMHKQTLTPNMNQEDTMNVFDIFNAFDVVLGTAFHAVECCGPALVLLLILPFHNIMTTHLILSIAPFC